MKTYVLIFLLFGNFVFAKGEKKAMFPTTALAIQYAGSIGWLSAGYFRQSANEKIELGIMYGYTPELLGGEIHSFALKFIYEPFSIAIDKHLQIEPIQTGIFVSENFTNNLFWSWSDKYDPGYYWWTNSMRFHFSLGTQASYVFNHDVLKKVSFYFETNTNDLYVFSYFGNHNYRSLGLDDIFFFGIGSKVYFN